MVKKDPNAKEKTKENTQQDDEVSITDDVRGADYYHGLVPRMDIEPLLKKDGDFLLRKTDNKGMFLLLYIYHHLYPLPFQVKLCLLSLLTTMDVWLTSWSIKMSTTPSTLKIITRRMLVTSSAGI